MNSHAATSCALRRRKPLRPALAPVLSPHGPVPADLDRVLGDLAARARAGDASARNTLFAAYQPRFDRWVMRAARICRYRNADPAVEPDDIRQLAFLVFADLLDAWPGDGSLSGYVIAYFPWRLSDAIRRLSEPRRHRSVDSGPALILIDGSTDASEANALLETIAGELPGRHGLILLWRVRDGLTFRAIATKLGVTERTIQRDWAVIVNDLRRAFPPD